MPKNREISRGLIKRSLSEVNQRGIGRRTNNTQLYKKLVEIKKDIFDTKSFDVPYDVAFYTRSTSAQTAARETTQGSKKRLIPSLPEGYWWEGSYFNEPDESGTWYCVSITRTNPQDKEEED